MIVIENKFEIGQIVYLKTDEDQCARIITGIHIRPTGITYSLAVGDEETPHYEVEITEQKNVLA